MGRCDGQDPASVHGGSSAWEAGCGKSALDRAFDFVVNLTGFLGQNCTLVERIHKILDRSAGKCLFFFPLNVKVLQTSSPSVKRAEMRGINN